MRLLLGLGLLLLGCGNQAAAVGGGVGGSGGTASDGGGTTASAGGSAPDHALTLSVLAETEAGKAPSLLRLANDTLDQRLAVTLPDGQAYAFYEVEWQTTTDYVPAAITSPVDDVILSVCTINACIRLQLDAIAGEQQLLPLEAYTLHVTRPDDDAFVAELVLDPTPEPFLGLRPLVIDGTASAFGYGTHLDLSLSGQEVVFEKVFTGANERYEILTPVEAATIDRLTYFDGQGAEHALPTPVTLPAAAGYTVVIASDPVAEAAVSVPLATP